jgi:hypothetical protein
MDRMYEQPAANPDDDRYEPFNGASEMLAIRQSEILANISDRAHVVLTARMATDSVWSMTIRR